MVVRGTCSEADALRCLPRAIIFRSHHYLFTFSFASAAADSRCSANRDDVVRITIFKSLPCSFSANTTHLLRPKISLRGSSVPRGEVFLCGALSPQVPLLHVMVFRCASFSAGPTCRSRSGPSWSRWVGRCTTGSAGGGRRPRGRLNSCGHFCPPPSR